MNRNLVFTRLLNVNVVTVYDFRSMFNFYLLAFFLFKGGKLKKLEKFGIEKRRPSHHRLISIMLPGFFFFLPDILNMKNSSSFPLRLFRSKITLAKNLGRNAGRSSLARDRSSSQLIVVLILIRF